MKYFIKMHLCVKITLNGLFRLFIGHVFLLIFAAVGALCPKYYNFAKTLSLSQDLKLYIYIILIL